MFAHRTLLLRLTLLCSLTSVRAYAQDVPVLPRARAVYTAVAPTIDGDLADPAWRAAPLQGGFRERRPNLNHDPPEDTTFRVLFDDEALYFAVRCSDSRPGEIRARTVQRDSSALFSDDTISIKLDPASDRRTTLGFAINGASGVLDYRGINESELRIEFDAVWQGAARIDDRGWSAELRIPFAALGLDPGALPARVGLNLSRDHSRRNATYDWALVRPPFSPISASRYGDLLDLDRRPAGARPFRGGRLQWALVPYVVGALRYNDDPQVIANGGLDLRLYKGEQLGVHLTINTDFAQADLDDQRVNLTRFGLYFPEKRDFFLRDSEIFAFGRPEAAQALQTRRIGLSAGQVVPLLNGLKLTARPLRWLRLGLLQAVTLPGAGQPYTLALLGRALFELPNGSNVGVLLAQRQSLERSADRNLVVGVDGALRGRGNLLLTGFAMVSLTGAGARPTAEAAGGPGTGQSGEFADKPAPGVGAELSWRGLLLRPQLRYAYYHPQLRADLGFLRRVGIHEAVGVLAIEPRLQRRGLERVTISLESGVVAGVDPGRLLDAYGLAEATLRWSIGFSLGAFGGHNRETVPSDFTVGRGLRIPAGVYDQSFAGVYGGTPGVWPVAVEAVLSYSGYYGADQGELRLALTALPIARVRLGVDTTLTRSVFGDERGVLDTAALNGRLALGFSTTLGLDGFVGWNSVADLVRLQGRLRYRYFEGSDLFLVLQSDLSQAGRVNDLSVLVKMTLQWPS